MEIVELTPAIKTDKTTDKEEYQMTPQEFQKTLYYWFNQKGLVSNMRSYLRMKMINELKNTTFGDTVSKIKKEISMENQAINILIADFLYQHHYDYSLSVFSTEIPIKTLVSEFCFFIFNNKEKCKRRHKMNEDNIICILDSFGLAANTKICRDIIHCYQNNDNVTLLFCILKIVVNYNKADVSISENLHLDDVAKIIKKNLMNYDLPSSLICHLTERVNLALTHQVNNNLSKLSNEYDEQIINLKKEFENKENDFMQKMVEKEKEISENRKKLEREHKKIIALTENMISNEKRLAEKSIELENKLKKINDIEIKLTNELKNQSKVKPPIKCNLKHCDKRCEENKELIEALKLQKNGFEKIAENQNMLIINLTSKSTAMYNELQESLATIEELKAQIQTMKNKENANKNVSETDTTESESGMPLPSDEDFAEEIIKQSQYKLQQLEKEGEEIDKKFKQFQQSFYQL